MPILWKGHSHNLDYLYAHLWDLNWVALTFDRTYVMFLQYRNNFFFCFCRDSFLFVITLFEQKLVLHSLSNTLHSFLTNFLWLGEKGQLYFLCGLILRSASMFLLRWIWNCLKCYKCLIQVNVVFKINILFNLLLNVLLLTRNLAINRTFLFQNHNSYTFKLQL